jgi:hypothetical protein
MELRKDHPVRDHLPDDPGQPFEEDAGGRFLLAPDGAAPFALAATFARHAASRLSH